MAGYLDFIGYEATDLPLAAVLVRVGLAAIFGGMIGFERELHHRGAGFRTHILVCVAACVFTMLGFELFRLMQEEGGIARGDMIRVIEAVTAGVAFLGAGTIFVSRGSVKGMTTGAGMWLAGAVGTATGLGHYLVGFAGSLVAIVALALLAPISERFEKPAKSSDRGEDGF